MPRAVSTHFPGARTTWSSPCPSPRAWLSFGSTESNVSSPGLPEKRERTRCQSAIHPSPPHQPLPPYLCPYLSQADPVAYSVSPEVLKHSVDVTKSRAACVHAVSGVISSQPHSKLNFLLPAPQGLCTCCSGLSFTLAAMSLI